MPHADRHARAGVVRRRTFARAGALLGCALLMAGCATMPDTGDITKVGEKPRTESDPQVRVFGVQPQNDEGPLQIVRGFLEATTSDEAGYQTAKDYLTGPARNWNPFTGITVLSGAPALTPVHNPANSMDTGMTIALTADQVAVVDRKSSYAPSVKPFRNDLHLTRVHGQWRIDSLPSGLVLGQSDFERIYRSVNMYYFAQLGSQADGNPLDQDVLVADPVYVRRRIDPVTSSVQALLAGPSTWLQPVVESAFPVGTQLKGEKLALDDSGVLRVPLGGFTSRLGRSQCARMAAQLLDTVQDQSSAQVNSVVVQKADGGTLCTLGHRQATAYAPARVAGSGGKQYFVDTGHRLESVTAEGDNPRPQHVPGPFGAAQAGLTSVAVSRNDQTAAGEKSGGRSLYTAPLSASGTEKHLLNSKVGLTAPSWDGLGDLWVADKDPVHARLLMWENDKRITVLVPALGEWPDPCGTRLRRRRPRRPADRTRRPHHLATRPRRTLRSRRRPERLGHRAADRDAGHGGRQRRLLGGREPARRGRQAVARRAAASVRQHRRLVRVHPVTAGHQRRDRRLRLRGPEPAADDRLGRGHLPPPARCRMDGDLLRRPSPRLPRLTRGLSLRVVCDVVGLSDDAVGLRWGGAFGGVAGLRWGPSDGAVGLRWGRLVTWWVCGGCV